MISRQFILLCFATILLSVVSIHTEVRNNVMPKRNVRKARKGKEGKELDMQGKDAINEVAPVSTRGRQLYGWGLPIDDSVVVDKPPRGPHRNAWFPVKSAEEAEEVLDFGLE